MKLLQLFALLAFSGLVFSQNQPSIHQEQLEEYNALGFDTDHYESLPCVPMARQKSNCTLNKIVYGWHPYWVGSAYQNYQWDLLSHMSFFSYEVDAATGQANSMHGWSTSDAVDSALANGTKVTLCVTLFSGHSTFFGSATSQQTLITNLINLVQSRGAHGVNIDFEGLPSSQTTNFANFMVNLSNQMHSAIPGSEVSTVLYAVDWNSVFDFAIMEPEVDHYIIMGYDYYWSGSSTAGPNDPLYHYGSNYNYTLSRSITYYLDLGCPKDKLVLGIPNYGREWPTSGLTVPSSTTGSGTARTYAYVKNNSSGNYSAANYLWNQESYADVYAFNDGGDRQCFISLDSAWNKRLEHVLQTGIAGIGIWALGYDNGYSELWDAMDHYLTDCYSSPCSGTIHDFGGPYKNYYDDEDYTWTIAPAGATSIDVTFTEFDVELNYDYLYIYDGADVNAPQIAGSPFTGTTLPNAFTSTTGALTFRFTSDFATVTPGFVANYTCNTQVAPTAVIGMSNSIEVCQGDSILMLNGSMDADSYQWSSSSGGISNSTAEEPYLFPSSSGNYSITLEATNSVGTDQITSVIGITVHHPPLANANISSTNLSLPSAIAYFTNQSTNASSYVWHFGDGTTSTDSNPWHEYSSTGMYEGMLIASNAFCDDDTLLFTITVGELSISETNPHDFEIVPNPATDKITISSSTNIGSLSIRDPRGRLVKFVKDINALKSDLEVSDLPKGVYYIQTDNLPGSKRLIKM